MIGLTGDWPVLVEIMPGAILLIDLIAQNQRPLLEEEKLLTTNATAARMREIRAGRTVARRAMIYAGIQPGAILAGVGGEPIWPAGVSGSLAHTHSHVAAVVARYSLYVSLGIDLDDKRSLGEEVSSEIAASEELELIRRLDAGNDSAPRAENAVFCAKEAIFKCQYNITQRSDLDFRDVVLRAGEPINSLKASASEAMPVLVRETVARISLKLLNIQGLMVAYAFIVAGASVV